MNCPDGPESPVEETQSRTNTRREYLRYAAFAGGLGASVGFGVTQLSQPAIAVSKPVTLPTGLEEGKINVSSYELQYTDLDPTEDITIEYILTINGTLQSESGFQSHTVPISEKSGTVMTGQHSITVPAGEIGLQIRVHHPSLGSKTAVTASNNPVTVLAAGIPYKDDLYAHYDIPAESYSDGQEIGSITDQTGNGNDLTDTSTGNPKSDYDSINGYNGVYFDDFDTIRGDVGVSPPYHIFVVRKDQGITNDKHWEFSSGWNGVGLYTKDYTFRATDGSNSIVSSETIDDLTPALVSILYDTDGELRVDGKTVATGDIGSNSLGTLKLSESPDANQYAQHMWYGHFLIYSKDMSSKQAEIEEELASQWDITLR